MKRGVSLFLLVLLLAVNSNCVFALTPLTLTEAKRLAVENARGLQTYKTTVEQLRLQAGMAKDVYEENDPYLRYNSTMSYLRVLKQEAEEIEVRLGDSTSALNEMEKEALANQLQSKLAQIAAQEMNAAVYQAQFPAIEGSDSQVKRMWDNAADFYGDTQIAYEQALRKMETAVAKLFFGIYYQELTLDILEKVSQIQNLQKQIVASSRALGLATEIDFQKATGALVDTAEQITALRVASRGAIWQLNDLMGREVTTPLKIVVPFYQPVLTKQTFVSLLETYWSQDVLLPPLRRDLERLEKDYKDTKDGKERALLFTEIEKKEIELTETEQAIKDKLKNILEGVETKYQAWQAAGFKKEEARLADRAEQCKYDLGLISKMQKMNSELLLKQAGLAETKATFDYYLVLHELALAEEGILELVTATSFSG